MSPRWEDVNARARGLASRLLPPAALERLAHAPDLQTLSRGLTELGIVPEDLPNATAPALDQALRRSSGNALAVARRWLGERVEVVAVALEEEDRRSLRALIRGAAAGVRAEARLAGLMPTPTLPERLLRDLAARSRVSDQAAVLVATGHPYGPALLAAAAPQEPDLFALELALARTFADRARRGAQRDGRFLRTHVADLIDIENCRQLLLMARREASERSASAFIPGGRRLTEEKFREAVLAVGPGGVARALGASMGGGATAALLVRHAEEPGALEDALEAEVGVRLTHEARLDPLGPAPLLLYCYRLREQTRALSDLVWRVNLGAPRPAEHAA